MGRTKCSMEVAMGRTSFELGRTMSDVRQLF